jgi:hypothetical protein
VAVGEWVVRRGATWSVATHLTDKSTEGEDRAQIAAAAAAAVLLLLLFAVCCVSCRRSSHNLIPLALESMVDCDPKRAACCRWHEARADGVWPYPVALHVST